VAAERHYKAIASAITASTAHGDAGLKAKAGALLLGEYAGKVSLMVQQRPNILHVWDYAAMLEFFAYVSTG
jgi:hypothetical protein